MDTLMTVKEAAQYLRLNYMTVYKLAQKGKIPASKIPSLVNTLKRGWIFFIPLAILIYFLFGLRYSPETAALWATVSIPIVTVLRREHRINWSE